MFTHVARAGACSAVYLCKCEWDAGETCEQDAGEMRARCALGWGGRVRCVVKIGTLNAFESSVSPHVTVHLVALLLAIGGLKRGMPGGLCDMHGSVPGVMGVMVLVARRTVSCSSRSRRASSSPQLSVTLRVLCCLDLDDLLEGLPRLSEKG